MTSGARSSVPAGWPRLPTRGPDAVARLLGCPSETSTVYPYAFGSAMAQMRDLLAILDELAPAQPTTGTAGGAR
jgi:hypothetical protein